MSGLFKTKPLDVLLKEASGDDHSLKKTLTAPQLVFLGVGAIIGAGIFTIIGKAALEHAGPAIIISFMIAGLGCAFAGLCYAEFAAMIPVSGSAYAYSYATMGEFVAWTIGWNLVLEYLFGAATVAVSWSGYLKNFLKTFGISLPDSIASAPFDMIDGKMVATGAIFNFPAVFLVIIITSLLVVGIQESAKFNNVIVILKVVVITLFIGLGAAYMSPDNLTPLIPENTGEFGHYGWSGILAGAGMIFFAYIGFDAVSTAAQEAKNPQRDMPIGILASLAICTIIYIAFSTVLSGLVDYSSLTGTARTEFIDAPAAYAIDQCGAALNWLKPLIKIGAIAGLSSVALIMLMGQPRIFYNMANDGLIPKWFGKVHPKYQTPSNATIFSGAVAVVVSGLFPLGLLGELVSIGTLMAFTVVCIGIFILRITRPDLPRPFKTPFYQVVTVLGALICLAQMIGLPTDTWIRLVLWMIIGIAIYFFYGRRHSKVQSGVYK